MIEHEVPDRLLPSRQRGRHGGAVVRGDWTCWTIESGNWCSGHERRHLRARHDLALAYSGALARTFPWVPLFAMAHAQIAVLLEMAADDAATSPSGPSVPGRRDRGARAPGVRPETALAASDTAALRAYVGSPRRAAVSRLGTGVPGWNCRGAGALLPLGLALAPAVEAATRDCCTVDDVAVRS